MKLTAFQNHDDAYSSISEFTDYDNIMADGRIYELPEETYESFDENKLQDNIPFQRLNTMLQSDGFLESINEPVDASRGDILMMILKCFSVQPSVKWSSRSFETHEFMFH